MENTKINKTGQKWQITGLSLIALALCATTSSPFQILTGSDAEEERESWNAQYRNRSSMEPRKPHAFVKEQLKHLPPKGNILLFPLEEGTNAIFLAKRGFEITGIDYSELAIQQAKRLARENKVRIKGVNADLNIYVFPKAEYDAIIALDFFRPRLVDEIKRSLKPGGVLLYLGSLKKGTDPVFRTDEPLHHDELKELFRDFELISYREAEEPKRKKLQGFLVARKKMQ